MWLGVDIDQRHLTQPGAAAATQAISAGPLSAAHPAIAAAHPAHSNTLQP
jgi:hypothetical protein